MINLKTSYFTRSFTRKSKADLGLQVWGDKFCGSNKTEAKSYDTLCCGCTQSLIIFKARQSLNSYQPISYLIVENESRIYTRAKAQPAEQVGLCASWIYTGKRPTCGAGWTFVRLNPTSRIYMGKRPTCSKTGKCFDKF